MITNIVFKHIACMCYWHFAGGFEVTFEKKSLKSFYIGIGY
jgi:hypothetical protein